MIPMSLLLAVRCSEVVAAFGMMIFAAPFDVVIQPLHRGDVLGALDGSSLSAG